MNTPDTITSLLDAPFIGVVFDGNGHEISRAYGAEKGEASGQALRVWEMAQYNWQSTPPAQRPADPPMWELYRKTRRVMPNGTPVYEAIRTRATVHHGFETAPGVPAE